MQAAAEKNDTRSHGSPDRELFCPRLQRLLMSAASELGQRGNLGQVVACIERGGSGGGNVDTDTPMLQRIGYFGGEGKAVVRQLAELELRWRCLARPHQANALAHYLGTPRAPETLRASFGEFAGVVLYRWQQRQANARARRAAVGQAKAAEALAAVQALLVPLERELAQLQAVRAHAPASPDHAPRPEKAPIPELTGDEEEDERLIRLWRSEWLALIRPWNARQAALRCAARHEHELRVAEAETRTAGILATLRPLRTEAASLCAKQAALLAAAGSTDDEQTLVDLCRNNLGEKAKRRLVEAAQGNVRAVHRAWQATGARAAMAWAEAETAG